MRAIGPGSVSSLLKIALDVVWWVLWVAVGALFLAAVLNLFLPDLLERLGGGPVMVRPRGSAADAAPVSGPLLSLGLVGFGVVAVGWTVVVGQLRKIFVSLTAGDPFHPDNVRRLRMAGLTLAGVEVATAVGRTAIFAVMFPEQGLRLPDLSGWFSVLVVFVLAEVFREGARLRREAELTI